MANPQLVGAVLSAAKDNDVAMMGDILTMMPSAAKAGNGIGQTALHVASIWGCTEVARLLIEAGADVDAQNKFGITPLASAAGKDRLQVAKLLLENGADPRLRSANGMTALEVATSDAMRVLLGSPTLEGHKAVIAADRSALEALLNEGSLKLSDQDSDGDTLLHLAVQAAVGEPVGKEPVEFGNTAMLDLLLQHDSAKGFAKAQRAHNDAGLMPLHIAVSRGNVAVCEVPDCGRTSPPLAPRPRSPDCVITSPPLPPTPSLTNPGP
jgi:ankyrin repeat protein